MQTDIFTDDYFNREVAFFGAPLTSIEVQSAAVAIDLAKGKVGTAGLGTGYFALRAAAKPEVSEVIVFEEDTSEIEYFEHAFLDRPEMEKIKVFYCGIPGFLKQRKMCRPWSDYPTGRDFDFFFMDTYRTMLELESGGGELRAISDMAMLCQRNNIKRYWFRGLELLVVDGIYYGLVAWSEIEYDSLNDYLRQWEMASDFSNTYITGSPLLNEEQVEIALEFMKAIRQGVTL